MSWRTIVRPEAEQDVTQAAIWYEKQEPGLGFALLEEFTAGLQQIAERPRSHVLLRAEPEVRRILTRRFPYRVIFLVEKDVVVILAALHAARREDLWAERLP